MIFSTLFGIDKGDVICIVGAGGKTSLIKRLAEECVNVGLKVLIGTTTRFGADQIDSLRESGADVSVEIDGAKAFSDIDSIQKSIPEYDIILLEADGAACKRLKGWAEHEPVIPEFTTKTIGVVDISVVGEVISDKIVHRIKFFCDITGGKSGNVVTKEYLTKIIRHDNGLFQYGKGQRFVYFSKAESDSDIMNAKDIAKLAGVRAVAGDIFKDFAEVVYD